MILEETQVHRSSIAFICRSGSNSNSVTHGGLISIPFKCASKKGGVSVREYPYPSILCFFFYLRGKSRRGDGGHVLRAQVLRGVGK